MNAVDFKSEEERKESLEGEVQRLQSLALETEEIDLRRYFDDNSHLIEDLLKYDLLWVRGGNTFILARAFHQSGADKVIKELIENGQIIYGGYSAGVCILSPTLKGIEQCDDPNILPEGYKTEIIWDGLNIINYSVAPHYRSPDHPETELIDKEVEYLTKHKIPFKTLTDGEAIVIDGNNEFLVG